MPVDYTIRSTAFVAPWGQTVAPDNRVGAPQAWRTIALALADLAANYPAASASAPHIISLEPGTYSTPAFALPPFTFLVGNPDGVTDPTAATVVSLTGNITLAAGWSVNQTAFGGFINVNLRQLTAANIDLTFPVPAAGNPARTIYLSGVRTNTDSLSYEATSTADAIDVKNCVHDGVVGDAIEFSAGSVTIAGLLSAAPITINATATIATLANISGVYTMAAPNAVAPGISFVSGDQSVTARMGFCDNRALTLNEAGAGVLTVYADAVSIPLNANVTYAGTATTADLVRTSDSGGIGPAAGTFYGLNGQTIVGNSSGAWAVNCNGANQSVTLAPSGTGRLIAQFVANRLTIDDTVAGLPALYLLPTATAPIGTNYLLARDANNAYLNGAVGVVLGVAGATVGQFNVGSALLATAVNSGAILNIGTNVNTLAGSGIAFGTGIGLYRAAAGQLYLDDLAGTSPGLLLRETGATTAEFFTSGGALTLGTTGAFAVAIRANSVTALSIASGGISTFASKVGVGAFTVGALGAATAGLHAYVTDSNATFTLGIGAVVAGGGANVVPVFADGTNWRIG